MSLLLLFEAVAALHANRSGIDDMFPTFPTGLFTPSSLQADMIGASIAGGPSLSGISQSATTSGGAFWAFTFGEAILWNRAKFNTWRALTVRSDNGATPFVVPLCDRIHQPFLPANVKRGAGIGDSDDSTFSDGALWTGEYITATITGSAALRATRITIAISGAADLVGGEFFTVWHLTRGQRLYSITRVFSQGGGVADIEIRPPLREATADGITCDFDNPRCQMRVVGSMAATLEQLKFGKSPQIRFVEDFQRAT